jgi:hypothetical protein
MRAVQPAALGAGEDRAVGAPGDPHAPGARHDLGGRHEGVRDRLQAIRIATVLEPRGLPDRIASGSPEPVRATMGLQGGCVTEPTTTVTIWIDADAAPRAVKDACFQVGERRGVPIVVVANQRQSIPRSGLVRLVTVGSAFDAADDHIAERCEAGDLVVTADVPLAARVVAKGALGIDPRGRVFDERNVHDRLGLRDLAQDLRDAGERGGGPQPFGKADRQRFLNALDRTLTALLRRAGG